MLCELCPTTGSHYSPHVAFDGANGVGAKVMMEMLTHLLSSLDVTMYNKGEGILNHRCGADFVKVHQCWPDGVPQSSKVRCVSVDGDADRVIYSYIDDTGDYHMLDGDKIATLVAGYLQQLLKESGITSLTLGLVQTAYANGASTAYISAELGVPVVVTMTGVKFLHHAAVNFDVGVYFEANGHGTVVFSAKAHTEIEACARSGNPIGEKLLLVMNVINETVGDAIADMLLVESILFSRGWSAQDWDRQYTDLPNRNIKVVVQDRNFITTTDAERKCVTPVGLQNQLDSLVSKVSKGRAFVRPSGTEDIVRVYAEAASQDAADQLATEIGQAVYDLAGGIGGRP